MVAEANLKSNFLNEFQICRQCINEAGKFIILREKLLRDQYSFFIFFFFLIQFNEFKKLFDLISKLKKKQN
jgi:hypothetical protein